jgi:cell division protein FtsB
VALALPLGFVAEVSAAGKPDAELVAEQKARAAQAESKTRKAQQAQASRATSREQLEQKRDDVAADAREEAGQADKQDIVASGGGNDI